VIGFFKKVLAVLALLVAAYAGFRWGPMVFPRMERMLGWAGEPTALPGPAQPTAELADATLERFERFRNGQGPERLALGGTELSAVVRHALPGIVPPGVTDPTVALDDGRVRLSARVALQAFPRLPALDEIVGILPDTVLIELEGALVPHDPGHLALLVDRLQAARIPIPRRLVGEVLTGFGRQAPQGFSSDALPVPLPDGLRSVYVQQDSLVLLADR
jgi:hypothetical protein